MHAGVDAIKNIPPSLKIKFQVEGQETCPSGTGLQVSIEPVAGGTDSELLLLAAAVCVRTAIHREGWDPALERLAELLAKGEVLASSPEVVSESGIRGES